jgi:hypothetical protein
MPRIESKPEPEPIADATEDWFDAWCADFRRSKRGSLWRRYDGLSLTVYLGKTGYRWVSSGPDGRTFSRRSWESEEEALSALFSELEGG